MIAPKQDRQRGATAVEYGLLVGLFVVVLFGSIEFMGDSASDELNDRGTSIGHPTLDGTTTTTSGGSGTTLPTTPTTVATYTGTITANCGGSGGNTNVCTYSLNPDPGPDVEWSIEPTTDTSGTPPAVTFEQPGDYTVQAEVGDTTVAFAVTCVQNGGNLKCNKK